MADGYIVYVSGRGFCVGYNHDRSHLEWSYKLRHAWIILDLATANTIAAKFGTNAMRVEL